MLVNVLNINVFHTGLLSGSANVRNGSKADIPEPPRCTAMRRGRSAATLSDGGAMGGFAQAL